MIVLNNINKYYNSGSQKFHALKDINLTLPEKGLVFIVGKSGSGKSTLLNVIGGIDSYNSGELIIDNLNTKDFSKKDFNSYRNSYVGFIFQEFNVIKNLSVYDNIALSLQLKNENVAKNNELILETIKKVGLEGKEKRKMNQLSGGERQRVAIARAIVKSPKIIIADEPTGNLDKKNRDIVMDILEKLSQNQLVLIVTHDKLLANKYKSDEITLKDGAIIKNTLDDKNINIDSEKVLNLEPIQPSIKTSLYLSFKSLKQNLLRFIMIILFFTISLIFASTTINLYFSDATAEYSKFQTEYNNKYITLSQEETLYDQTIKTGFFQIDTINYEDLINSYNLDENKFNIYKSFKNPIQIDQNLSEDYILSSRYSRTIDNAIIINDVNEFKERYNIIDANNQNKPVRCFITDYIAKNLIECEYFDEPFTEGDDLGEYFSDKTITADNFNQPIYIEGIIETNYSLFENVSLDDPNYYASFKDNLTFYNSLFFRSSVYVGNNNLNQFVSTNNIKYTEDDFVFSALNNTGIVNNVEVTSYNDSLNIIKGKKPEKKPTEESLEQIVISTAMLDAISSYSLDDLNFLPLDKSIEGSLLNPETNTPATFVFYGYRRIMSSFSCQVVGIIESDVPTIYFCNPNETNMYYNYLKTSFSDYDNFSNMGGYLVVEITNDEAINTSLYETLRTNDIKIDNLSYIKLQVVNDFIDENLILFIGLFFSLCLFSILMIFNFVVITIKNSTKDIGIYMSLGMSGFKIACIYLFQILLVSTITFILSSIGAVVFLNFLDTSLSADASNIINQYFNLNIAPIDFTIFNITMTGFGIALAIAYIVPLLSVLIPLVNLSRKKPLDVLKVS